MEREKPACKYRAAPDTARTHDRNNDTSVTRGPIIKKMAEILDKMVAADVIVIATPVYFYTMDAQMKTLIDRTVPRFTEITNKDFYFIVTGADPNQINLERTIDGFRGFTDCLTDPHEKEVIYATGVWESDDVKNHPAMKQAYEVGKLA